MADIDYQKLTENALQQIKTAQERYNFADAKYNQVREKFQLGEVDKIAFDEAFENRLQAYAELEELQHEHFAIKCLK
ncbi:hypothetical protein DI392_08205 [Vibrio albus]|uniref:Uncharacterized protein n=1 Tax=Vibrio albus TaxID=2200953 RepID=A0A2U3BBJ5_9VIBR|nr:TolC family protein [Vibrio albus]PWI34160.1 hypothetical protein DI392_08205 [Vibrio albus]